MNIQDRNGDNPMDETAVQEPVEEIEEEAEAEIKPVPLDCQVPNCPNIASWRCKESAFRYCETHRKHLGAHGFDAKHPHHYVKIYEISAEEKMLEMQRSKTLLCFAITTDPATRA